jgi:hypothetical protein
MQLYLKDGGKDLDFRLCQATNTGLAFQLKPQICVSLRLVFLCGSISMLFSIKKTATTMSHKRLPSLG